MFFMFNLILFVCRFLTRDDNGNYEYYAKEKKDIFGDILADCSFSRIVKLTENGKTDNLFYF